MRPHGKNNITPAIYSIMFNKEPLSVQTNSVASWRNVLDSLLSLNMCIRVQLMSIASTLRDASTSKRASTSKHASTSKRASTSERAALTPSLDTQFYTKAIDMLF